ncbi:MAG: class I SAM-dependent methyltransferase [Candidatus Omnitrophica bacterium]|nr:class I SAM-dependent methyltransferase [Candidatus Omnitrophota bacterium]
MEETDNIAVSNAWQERWKDASKIQQLTLLGRQAFKAKRKALEKIIKKIDVGKVIEVGCGLGYTLKVFKDAGLDCVGIDISPEAVSFCKKKALPAVQKRLEDVTEQYDLVSSDGMLEHFLDFEPYAKYLMRISRKYVLLIQPNHDSFRGKTLVYLAGLSRSKTNVYEYNYRIEDFVRVFKKNNFYLEQDNPVFFNMYRLLLFKKRS